MMPVACSRMYNVAPGAAAAWTALFQWISSASGVSLAIIEHRFPERLETLWSRPDLGAVFMCGRPFALARPQPLPVAAPIPAGQEYQGRPVYSTRFIVRDDAPYRTLSDTFGSRLGWTALSSQSGYHAVSHHLRQVYGSDRDSLYPRQIGPLVRPSGVIEALLANRIDLGPLDSYAYDLLCRHAPDQARRVRILESTRMTPIPLLVASPGIDPAILSALRTALTGCASYPAAVPLLERLSLQGFARARADSYRMLIDTESQSKAGGM